MSALTKFVESLRLDSAWTNAITGMGVQGVDKRLNTVTAALTPLPSADLSNMFHGDPVAARAVSCLPEESLSKGLGVSVGGNDGMETTALLESEFSRLKVAEHVLRAAIFARLYGGAVVVLGVDDGLDQDQPLVPARVRSLVYLRTMDKRKLVEDESSIDLDPMSLSYGKPLLYRIAYIGRAGRTVDLGSIHRSRLVFLPGALTDDETREAQGGWDLSVLQRMERVLADNASAWAAVATRLQESSYTKTVIKDLVRILAAPGGEASVKDRIKLLNYGRSVAKTIVLDSEESYTRDVDNMSGIGEVLDKHMALVAAAVPMPATKLWGTSAQGLNATGEGDADDWTRQVATYREQVLAPAFGVVVEMLLMVHGIEAENWEITWPELDPMDDKERAEVYERNAKADIVYLTEGVLTAPEIALHRFPAGGYESGASIAIDKDMREAQLGAQDEDLGGDLG